MFRRWFNITQFDMRYVAGHYKSFVIAVKICKLDSIMHRTGQRCFELLALIGSPQLSFQRYSQLNKHLGLTGKPYFSGKPYSNWQTLYLGLTGHLTASGS